MFSREQKVILLDHLDLIGRFGRTERRLMEKLKGDGLTLALFQSLQEDRVVNGVGVDFVEDNHIEWGIDDVDLFLQICPIEQVVQDAKLVCLYVELTSELLPEGEAVLLESNNPNWLYSYCACAIGVGEDNPRWNAMMDRYERIHGELPFPLHRART